MKHRCTNCNKEYDEDAEEIINGCSCGNNRFFFIKTKSEERQNAAEHPDEEGLEISEIIEDYEIAEEDDAVILDTESVNIIDDGKYEIDIASLLEAKIPVYRYSEGKYSLDLKPR